MRCIYYDKSTECKFYQHFHLCTIGHRICVHCRPYRLVKLFVYLNFDVYYIPFYRNGPYLGLPKIETILIWEWCIRCVWILLIVKNWKLFAKNNISKIIFKGVNNAVGLGFKVRFMFFRTCKSCKQCMRPSQKTQTQHVEW